MKPLSKRSILYVSSAALLACAATAFFFFRKNGAKTPVAEQTELIAAGADTVQLAAVVSEPTSVKRDSIEKKQAAEGPFSKIGCCADKQQSLRQNCCCPGVFEEYRALRETKSVREIAKIKRLDPIFNRCARLFPDSIALIENPKPKTLAEEMADPDNF